jgi:hypothetical protein
MIYITTVYRFTYIHYHQKKKILQIAYAIHPVVQLAELKISLLVESLFGEMCV